MSNKKRKARLKRQREEAVKTAQEPAADRRRGTAFTNYSTGIIFILTGIICAACFIAAAVYMENGGGKVANMIILALMAVYFLIKAPSYLRTGNQLRKEKKKK